jgi:hypothetical protein
MNKRFRLIVFAAVASFPSLAHADPDQAPRASVTAADTLAEKADAIVMLSTAFGTGLRFNNPYRLSSILGSSAEGVSRTASYVDVGAGVAWGRGRQLRHGATLHCAFAVEGIGQWACSPGYLLYRRTTSWATFARVGPAFVATPNFTWGGELAAGAAWFPLGGVGITGELVGNLFYGAGTREVSSAAYPVLSAQVGLTVAYEVLP